MKALILKSNKKFNIENIILSPIKNNECRIKIMNVGICSSDIPRSFQKKTYFYPLIMGHEISGKIVDIGTKVKNFKINDKVSIYPLIPCMKCNNCMRNNYQLCIDYKYYGSRNNGGYCEFLNVNEWNLIKLPKNITYENGSLIEPLSVVISAIRKLNINYKKINSNILIIGSGFLGLLALKLMRKKSKNINVSIIDKNILKINKAKKFTNYAYIENERKFNKDLANKKFDYILEATGSTYALKRSIELASNNAKIVWIGNISEKLNLNSNTVMNIIRKEIKIQGSWNSQYKNNINDDWKKALKYLNNGLYIKDIITHRMKLDKVPGFLKKINDHKNKKNKFNYIKGMLKI